MHIIYIYIYIDRYNIYIYIYSVLVSFYIVLLHLLGVVYFSQTFLFVYLNKTNKQTQKEFFSFVFVCVLLF